MMPYHSRNGLHYKEQSNNMTSLDLTQDIVSSSQVSYTNHVSYLNGNLKQFFEVAKNDPARLNAMIENMKRFENLIETASSTNSSTPRQS